MKSIIMEMEEIKLKMEELDLARSYLNSDYYWKRMNELKHTLALY